MKLPRVIKFVEKKIRHRNAAGLVEPLALDTFLIDPRLDEKHRLEVCIHESLHLLLPRVSEMLIRAYSKRIASLLWRDGWRRVWE